MSYRFVAIPSDLESLLETLYTLSPKKENEVVDKKILQECYERILQSTNQKIFVQRNDGKVVSTVELVEIPNLTHGGKSVAIIRNVATCPEFREFGYASNLLRVALLHITPDKFYTTRLICDPELVPFYQKHGFEVKITKDGKPLVVMERRLK